VRHSVLVEWVRRVRRENEDENEKMSHVLFLKKEILLFRRVSFLLGPHLLMLCTPSTAQASPFPFHSNSRLPATPSTLWRAQAHERTTLLKQFGTCMAHF